MRGGIYTREKCPICGKNFRDNGRNGMQCPNHPKHWAARNFQVRFLSIHREFKSYQKASRFLNGLRYEVDTKKFDIRDYQEKKKPIAFENMADTWIEVKRQGGIRKGSFKNIFAHMKRAIAYFSDNSMKSISTFDLQKYLLSLSDLSEKSKHNHMSTLRQFWTWVSEIDETISVPKFPTVTFTLGWRKTISKDVQLQILDEVRRIAPKKVWVGIKFLSTYFNVRPGELLAILEKDIELNLARIWIRKTKEREAKYLYLIDEDVELLSKLPPVINKDIRFFRHESKKSGTHLEAPYGEKYFYKWWKRASGNLGINDVDLYGGTRHSTVQHLRDIGFSPEDLKMASGHSTSRSFTRYFGKSPDYLRRIYAEEYSTKSVTELVPRRKKMEDKLLK